MPKRVKYRKPQRGRIRGFSSRGNYVAFGDYGLMALEPGWITAQELESARIVLARFLGSSGRYWCRIFPHKAITARAAESRMGKGKGNIAKWVAAVKPGMILFEVTGIPEMAAREVFRLQSGKLSVRVKFLARRAKGR
jgi:large subunit ribosomal protein L16